MTASEFLKEKGIVKEHHTTWICRFEDGSEFDIGQLMEEYANRQSIYRRHLLGMVVNHEENILQFLPETLPLIKKHLQETF